MRNLLCAVSAVKRGCRGQLEANTTGWTSIEQLYVELQTEGTVGVQWEERVSVCGDGGMWQIARHPDTLWDSLKDSLFLEEGIEVGCSCWRVTGPEQVGFSGEMGELRLGKKVLRRVGQILVATDGHPGELEFRY